MALPTRKEVAPALRRVLHRLGGEASVRDVIPLVTAEFPEISPEDLARNLKSGQTRWENRIHWGIYDLRKQGDVSQPEDEDSKRGKWTLTEQGREKAASEARGEPMTASPGASSQDTSDPSAEDDDDAPAPASDDDDGEQTGPHGGALSNGATQIASELITAGTDSTDSKRLEISVAEALRFLGFDAKWIGGPGQPDVVAVAPLGVDRYVVVVDAKSTSSGKVGDHQVNWHSISDHRRQEHADYSCIIGPGFAGGNLRKRARDQDTQLLTTSQLAEIVQIHADSPVSLKTLEQLFDASTDAATAVHKVRSASRENDRRRQLALKLMRIINRFNRTKPDEVLANLGTLRAILIDGDDPDATRKEVKAALALLETHGILRRSNGEGYVSQTSLNGAKQMLEATPNDDDEDQDASAI